MRQSAATRSGAPAQSAPEPSEAPAPPPIIDRSYVLREQLGEGGMGAVYRARRRGTDTHVALKLVGKLDGGRLATHIASRKELRLAIAREFQTLSSLHHPNVIRVLDYGFDEVAGPYFTMELLPTSRTIVDAALARPIEQKIELLAQVLRALVYVHQRGIVHRDLKPTNVLCVGAQAMVVDFGLATATPHANEVAGTPYYMAPELFAGAAPSVRSDLYSFGVLASEVLMPRNPLTEGSMVRMGQLSSTMADPEAYGAAARSFVRAGEAARANSPFGSSVVFHDAGADSQSGSDLQSGADHEAGGAPLPQTIPPEIYDILARLQATNPENRYATAAEVLADLSMAIGLPLPVETAATRESFLQASAFIGRERELGELTRALEGSAGGSGSGWLVGGESGVGKSRLVSELRTLALVQGATVAHGQAISEGGGSYEVWMPVLRTLALRADLSDAEAAPLKELLHDLPDLLGRDVPDPPKVPPDAARTRLLASIRTLLSKQPRATVILLEDLQWADGDSMELVAQLDSLVPTLPVLLVGNYRDEEAPDLPTRAKGMHTLKLERLDKDQIARLSCSMLGRAGEQDSLVDYLCRQTEGNLFFLVEIVRALAENAGRLDRIDSASLPENILTGGIERIALRRIHRVLGAGDDLLELSATAGRHLDLKVLRQALPGVDPQPWLLTCANAAVLDCEAGEWRFAHDKLREAVLARLSPEACAALHRRVGEAIEIVYSGAASDGKAAALAYHFQQAGDHEKASLYRLRAGDIATRLCSYVEARMHYAGALTSLAHVPESDDQRRRKIDTLLKQVYTTMVADSTTQNLARMTEAQELLVAIAANSGLTREDKLRSARTNYFLGRVHFYRADVKQAIRYYRQVLPEAQESGDDELLALPSCLIGTALLAQGDVRQAVPLLAQAIDPLERLGEPFEWFRAVGYHGFSLIGSGRYREGLSQLERVHERARQIGQPSLSSGAHLMRGTARTLSGDWPEVLADMQKVLEFASRTGDNLHLSLAWSNIGWALCHLGDPDKAVECREKAHGFAKAMGGRVMFADWYDGADAEIALCAGRFDAALEKAQAVAANAAVADLLYSDAIAERVWGAVLDRRGNHAEADAHMTRAVEILDKAGLALQEARTRISWAILKRRRGDPAAQALFDHGVARFLASDCTYALDEARRMWAQS